MVPAFGIGYGQVFHQEHWIADVLYDILYQFPNPKTPPVVHINLYLRTGQLHRFMNKPDLTLVLVDGSSYPIIIAASEFPECFSAHLVPPVECLTHDVSKHCAEAKH